MYYYELVIQLGSQVKYSPAGHYELAPHTAMRTEASAIVLTNDLRVKLIIAGGSNFGVRYNDQELLKPPDFSFEAFANADLYRRSEAAVIKDVLVEKYGVQSNRIFPETLSSTTEENAEFVKILLKRRPAFTGNETTAVLTLLYHMERALPIFRKAGLAVHPLFAENVLANNDRARIDEICQYYATPKGGKQYPVDQIHQLLSVGRSLEELMRQ